MKKTSKILAFVLAVCMISALCACGKTAEAPAAEEATSTIPEGGFKIACSTGMGGNTWVAQYNDDFTQHCEMYKEMGLVSDYQIVNTNADLTEQINQCTSLINSGSFGPLQLAVYSRSLSLQRQMMFSLSSTMTPQHLKEHTVYAETPQSLAPSLLSGSATSSAEKEISFESKVWLEITVMNFAFPQRMK